jgi:cell division protein FtsI/penicillin-binding protein 2
MQPYVVDSIWHADDTEYALVEQKQPKIYRTILQKGTVDTIYPALLQVVTDGTARSMVKSFITKAPLDLGYTLAGKTGTAELTDNDTQELAWFICWRDSKDGVKVTADNARLVCIMLEIDLTNLALEWNQMKFDIARALLKDDVLNETEG